MLDNAYGCGRETDTRFPPHRGNTMFGETSSGVVLQPGGRPNRLMSTPKSAGLVGSGLTLIPVLIWWHSPAIVRLVLTLDAEPRRLPVMRSRDEFDATFYGELFQNWLSLPTALSVAFGLLVLTIARDERASGGLKDRFQHALQRRPVWLVLTAVILLGAGTYMSAFLINENANDYDAAQNVGQALIRSGRLDGAPNNFRDPLPPAMLSLQFRFDPRLSAFQYEHIEVAGPHQIPLKHHNLALIVTAFFFLSLTARSAVKDRMSGFIIWVMVILFSLRYAVPVMVNSSMSEPHGLLFLSASTLFAHRATRATNRRALGAQLSLAGGMLGLLSLAKGSYLFVSLAFMVLLAALMAMNATDNRWKHALRNSSFLMLGFLLAHAPFAVERAQLEQGLLPSNRGGMVLAIRAGYSDLDRSDWTALVAVGGPLPTEAWGVDSGDLKRIDGPGSRTTWKRSDFIDADRVAQSAGRPEDAHSFYSQGVGQCARLGADRACREWAIEQFRSDWSHYARITAVVYWSEFWVFMRRSVVDAAVNLLVFGGLHVALAVSLWQRRPDLFAVSALPLGMMAFHALTIAPVNLTRFGRMNAPVVALGTLILVSGFIQTRAANKKALVHAETGQ